MTKFSHYFFALFIIFLDLLLFATLLKGTCFRAFQPFDICKIIINFFKHLNIGCGKVFVLFIGDDAFLTNAEDAIRWNFYTKIGNSVCLAIAKACNNRLFVVWKDFIYCCKQFYFQLVRSFLYYLSSEGYEVILRAHEERPRW